MATFVDAVVVREQDIQEVEVTGVAERYWVAPWVFMRYS
jgi:hypothetical protein